MKSMGLRIFGSGAGSIIPARGNTRGNKPQLSRARNPIVDYTNREQSRAPRCDGRAIVRIAAGTISTGNAA